MIKIKRAYATPEEIPETFRPFYVEADGRHVPDFEIEGMVPASKVQEFRDANTRLKQEHDEALKKFEGVDPEEYRDLKGRAKDLEEGKLLKRQELEPIRKAAIAEALEPWKVKEREWQETEAKYKGRLREAIIGSRVIEIGQGFGLKKGAGVALKRIALDIFDVDDDGKEAAKNSDGTPKYDTGGDPYTLERFAKDLCTAEDGKFMFEENSGGGGQERRGGAGGGDVWNGPNPFDPKTRDAQKQSDLMRTNFPLAKRLAAKVGKVLADPISFVPIK